MESKRPIFPGEFIPETAHAASEMPASLPDVRLLRQREGKGYFRKPELISMYSTDSVPLYWKDRQYFIDSQMQAIERYVFDEGLTLARMTNRDVDAVMTFLYERYPREIAAEISAFDLWRFIEYGHGVLIWDDAGRVKGCIFEIGYSRRAETSFTIRLAVAAEIEGKNLGYHLMLYSCLIAMQEGARVKRGLIQFSNQKSLHINLNKVGWICESFVPDACGLGPFFDISLPLDPAGLFTNAVDLDQIPRYMASHHAYIDYRLIDAEDIRAVAQLYECTDFKIVAMLKHDPDSGRPCFFALPASVLGLALA